MPRGIKNTLNNAKEIAKVRTKDNAQDLLDLAYEYQEQMEKDILHAFAYQPTNDLADLQAQYKASKALIGWLTSKVNDGKRASRKLDEE